ncbi:MAG TPA: PQQ-dependent sugar dehydrogenase [Pyrinomonadaceae bacterium]|nr:PQQ-dependent sugar dehydrogenase [Pyrinomonadaceae bacterium]
MKSLRSWVGAATLVLAFSAALTAQTPIPIRLQLNYITGLSSPVLLTHAKDGSGRKFILERGGVIKVVQPGSTTPTIFVNITARVLSGGERGLLGLAFHPNFATNSYFFVNYTRQTDGATIVSRFTATSNNTQGDPNSERILLTIPQPFSNHNGGMIEFREDLPGVHNLYVGMGDGGSANDPGSRSQNINELLGKYLRITPDVSGNNANPPYTNPPDNPYVGTNGADEIYAIGVRNPWRWSFDRRGSRQLYAGDVGQGLWEEMSIITLGGNFGWRVYEGTQCTGLDPTLCTPSNFIMPVFQYANSGSPRCAITGGYVYRGLQGALPLGSYLYGDYCTGEILLWHQGQQLLLLDTARNISSFGEDEAGELYVVGLGGTVDKVLGNKVSADFDGDARTDLAVYRPSEGVWYILNSGTGAITIRQFGLPNDIPVAEDYDGDYKADVGVFRPSDGTWYYVRSSDSTFTTAQFGAPGDVPVPGDYDGDGLADLTVYRPSDGVWYSYRSTDGGVTVAAFGLQGDVPTPSDYDGDGVYDISVFRPSTGHWHRLNSSNGSYSVVQFGLSGDLPAYGDFDGDLKTDIAIYRPSEGMWYILRSSDGGVTVTRWGLAEDKPVVGDYDGDGKDDIAVYRPSTGTWYVLQSSNQSYFAAQFGVAEDVPIPASDRP